MYYADGDRYGQPTVIELLQLIDREQIQWLLIDTFDKYGPSLCDLLNHSKMSHLVQQFGSICRISSWQARSVVISFSS